MRLQVLILVLVAAAVLPGCGSTWNHDMVVSLDEAILRAANRPTIQVDVVGLNDAERKLWDEMSLSEYWMPGSALRQSVDARAVKLRFSGESSQLFVIEKDKEIWKTWQRAGADWIYVVANLPGGANAKKGADDSRRLAISLNSKEWEEGAVFEVLIRRDEVVFRTPRKGPGTARTN